jgi:hypothetical protein
MMRHRLVAVCAAVLLWAVAASAADPWSGRQYPETVSEDWYSVLFGGVKIGFSTTTVDAGPEGYRVAGRAVIRLEVMGAPQDLSFSQTFHLDRKKNVVGFVALQNAGPQRMTTVGRVEKGVLRLTVSSGAGGERTIEKEAPHGLLFLETLGVSMKERLREGFHETLPVFVTAMRAVEPLTVTVGATEKVTVGGKSYDAHRVAATMRGFTTTMWITPDGTTVKETEPTIGVTSELTTEEEATRFGAKGIPVASLIAFSLVKPDRPIEGASRIRKLSLTLTGLDSPRAIPRDERQRVGAPVWSAGVSGERKMSLPLVITPQEPPGGMSLADVADEFPDYLAATPEIQSDHSTIVALAAQIVDGERDAWKAAAKINRWVFTNIEKELVDSLTALDVLAEKKGECQAHTNLFTALARAAGIPTKAAGGLVYSTANDGFLYHAWPEVYVGAWVAVDPTLGQSVADATHIKLFDGGLEEQIKLIRFIGRIGVTVVDREPKQ